jgi:hypothetical protein
MVDPLMPADTAVISGHFVFVDFGARIIDERLDVAALRRAREPASNR